MSKDVKGVKSLVGVLLASASLLAGCGAVGQPAASSASQVPSVTDKATPATGNAAFDARAALVAQVWQDGVLTAWAKGFVPLQELTVVSQVSRTGTTRDFDITYTNGCIRSASPLPDTTGRGDVRFADGTSMPVPLVVRRRRTASSRSGLPTALWPTSRPG